MHQRYSSRVRYIGLANPAKALKLLAQFYIKTLNLKTHKVCGIPKPGCETSGNQQTITFDNTKSITG